MVLQTVSRRKFVRVALIALLVGGTAAHGDTAQSPQVESRSGRQLPLREQLLYGLSVATKSDREFVDRVVALVHVGVLPRKLVDSTFLWARQQASLRGGTAAVRPMIYFRPALVMRAKKLGIKI